MSRRNHRAVARNKLSQAIAEINGGGMEVPLIEKKEVQGAESSATVKKKSPKAKPKAKRRRG